MTTAIQKVAKNVLKHFGKSLFPHAVYIRTPMPKRTPLRDLNVPDELAVILEKYEPRIAGEGLYAHQAAFLKAFLHEGKTDFLITTATGSGKSFCFWAWVFEHLRRDPKATAILCFPTQALMWGQAERLRRISKRGSLVWLEGKETVGGGLLQIGAQEVGWTIWQGVGTGATHDKELEEYQDSDFFWRARIRVATLDKAHWSLFRSWKNKQFAARLRCFVLDEAHSYDGVFGANVHYFLKRLYLAAHVMEKPRPYMFLASATLAGARQFAANLLSLPPESITHIEDEVRQQIETVPLEQVLERLAAVPADELVRMVFLIDDSEETTSVTDLLYDGRLIGRQVNAIYFSQSKFQSKLLAKGLKRGHDGHRKTCIYDADLPPTHRRKIERQLNDPKVTGVTVLGTSALELGVDIEGLDVCLINHTPPRRADLLQRIGRVGRRTGRPGLVILRLSAKPHDRDMIQRVADAFRFDARRPLPLPLHLDMCRWRHMLAAYNEWKGNLKYQDISWDRFNDAMKQFFGEAPWFVQLEARFKNTYGSLIDTSDSAWVHQGFRASASEGKIPLRHGDIDIARIEDIDIFRDAHPGAVFLAHDLKRYRVVSYEGRWKVARWDHPESQTVLGKWLKDIREIQVEPERRAVTTRGLWQESCTFWENMELDQLYGRPKKGSFKFGVWDFTRSWDGYREIDLDTGDSVLVTLAEATQQFHEAVKSNRNAPFLHKYSYRTVGWQWSFGNLELDYFDEEEMQSLVDALGGLLEHFFAAAVESVVEDIAVALDLTNFRLTVLDGTPGGNGLAEALLCEGRVARALGDCCEQVEQLVKKRNKNRFDRYFIALHLSPPPASPEEVRNVIRELYVRWAG